MRQQSTTSSLHNATGILQMTTNTPVTCKNGYATDRRAVRWNRNVPDNNTLDIEVHQHRPNDNEIKNTQQTEAVPVNDFDSTRHICPIAITSVNLAGSLAVIVLAAVSTTVALATKNWSASGTNMKMGLWDFCILQTGNTTWACFPVNTDFSVATQAFSILAAMCYACTFVLYLICTIFHVLQRSRPLTIAMCLVTFAIVCLHIMTLVVYGAKHSEMYLKIEKKYFPAGLEQLYLSWSYYFEIISTILSTVTGVLLFMEFKNLTFEHVYEQPLGHARHA